MTYNQKRINNPMETKFLGLTIDDTLSWKQHIEWVVNKMCTAFIHSFIYFCLPSNLHRYRTSQYTNSCITFVQ